MRLSGDKGLLVKVCGLRDEANVRAVVEAGADLIGFIFYPRSPRYVGDGHGNTVLPYGAPKVGVFVNASVSEILARVEDCGLDFVQLHGDEGPEFCRELKAVGVGVIKAFRVGVGSSGDSGAGQDGGLKGDSILGRDGGLDGDSGAGRDGGLEKESLSDIDAMTAGYEACCDYYLFDTQCSGYGGSGRSFDWSVLEGYHGSVPFLLSGGLGPSILPALKDFHHPRWAGVDLNSGFEIAPGLKDAVALREFISGFRDEVRNF